MPHKFYNFTVEGYLTFPTDMLRYDACWPADTDSALKIVSNTRVFTNEDGKLEKEKKVIRLTGIHPPTIDRWKSFSWKVVER